jgi:hypothetical protein
MIKDDGFLTNEIGNGNNDHLVKDDGSVTNTPILNLDTSNLNLKNVLRLLLLLLLFYSRYSSWKVLAPQVE